jgi:phosphoenolpyruvate synthase/pyruvate phosphate dikinase
MKFKVIFWSILLGAHSICNVLIAMKASKETYPVEACGNKTHNLFSLTKLEQDITVGKLVYHVHVPNFVGISHAEVKAYLDIFGIMQKWADLCGQWRAKTQQFFKDKKFDPVFLAAVETLGNDICACFETNIFPSLARLIDEHKFAGTTLMVRSTGKEDTAAFANAGGNETVANVDPTPQAVSAAMGKVVASYIGSKSLKQRLAVAQTEQQVQELLGEPFVPVLLQVMVGEKLDGESIATDNDLVKLPVSGVMFTTEAEGQTPGVTHLQTTFGHNEAVVNSLVPVDTWYIAQDGVYYPVIRNKTHRYIPVSGGGLCKEPKANTRVDGTSFGELPTLPGPAVRMLKQLANRIQLAYDNAPMDVELVVMLPPKPGAAGTIYLVQARPIVFGKKELSYQDLR